MRASVIAGAAVFAFAAATVLGATAPGAQRDRVSDVAVVAVLESPHDADPAHRPAGAVDHPDDVYWKTGLGVPGFGAPVYVLAVYGNELIAGGEFVTAGGAEVNYIARWNGSSWSSLGSGMNYWVGALAVYNNDLIAAGDFTVAGGVAANRIARWNGSSWSPLGSGMNNAVSALTVHDGDLVAGGTFTTAGGKASARAASWDPDPTGIGDDRAPSSGLALMQNYPNPFNPTTTISFTLPERTRAVLAIYDVEGRHVRTLVDEVLGGGPNQATWDGLDAGGNRVSSGVYLYRLEVGNQVITKKLTILK